MSFSAGKLIKSFPKTLNYESAMSIDFECDRVRKRLTVKLQMIPGKQRELSREATMKCYTNSSRDFQSTHLNQRCVDHRK